MADEEERGLEKQLEFQLEEQKESLTALKDALVLDPTNTELSAVHEELILAIRDAEEGLFHLKRSRLLQEADAILSTQCSKSTAQDVLVEPHDPVNVEAEPLEEENFPVGSKCRFRHTDGRWYNGQIIALNGSSSASITFLTPTCENMLICKFFLQQRCRFGTNCRLSHGIDVPVSSLKSYIPTIWKQSLVGSNIWANSEARDGIWRKAELESWDDTRGLGQVVFEDDGSSTKVDSESLSLSEFAHMSNDEEEEEDSSYEQSDDSDSEEESSGGLGFMEATALQRGIQTDTAVFAKWEHHTRGIASKMMANMGYREGMGLGVSGQGMVDPISVKVLKPKQSLDHAFDTHEKEGNEKKKVKRRSRGGKRKRDKKYAAEARAEKVQAVLNPDVFSFINYQLATQGEAQNGSSSKRPIKGVGEENKEDRKILIAYNEKVKVLKTQVKKLEEMVGRNRKEKVVYEAFSRKLNETRKALADAEAIQASTSNALASKQKEKRMLKF
ncbi:Zinc finger ccch-type with g patch domain-containing protein [Thalictrum thalictroides]|uniref:Zinc finger ccch-type with g patch domain-containing protein n=1 Tax=Thalictrum thalictroides TaxID=46969 RepID=A0A7J6XF18_THATH|nr:Zinc finger ccch-type with g patch domain-containing protein [Thalictrum thalictroides]